VTDVTVGGAELFAVEVLDIIKHKEGTVNGF
jgi:hypothetical protein